MSRYFKNTCFLEEGGCAKTRDAAKYAAYSSPIVLNMEHTTISGEAIDWNAFGPLQDDPFMPDEFHHTESDPKSFTFSRHAGIPHVTTLPNIEEDFMARAAVLLAWLNCRTSRLAVQYYRETVFAALAPFVFSISRSEDAFQKGMMAVWEDICKWATKYPINHDNFCGPDSDLEPLDNVLDDVIKHARAVAKNAMCGRKRKPVLIGDDLVSDAEVITVVEYDVAEVINELTTDEVERRVLRLKSDRLCETQIGLQTGLSRDQVNRMIKPLYASCCKKHDLAVKPMGRARRESTQKICRPSHSAPTST